MKRIILGAFCCCALLPLVGLGGCVEGADPRRLAGRYQLAGLKNPFIEQRADPWIYLHEDGYYYFTATVPEYDRIELRRADTLAGLPGAEAKVVWEKHASGQMGSHIWAPEIHYIDGKWYIYFAAGGAQRIWDIRIYVLENASANPLQGSWTEKGQIKTFAETFALDATTFELRGERYLVWAQKDRHIPGNTNLYLARLANPWTLASEAVLLSKPEFPWEQQLFWVNEGPAVLVKNGRVFLTYSASGTDANYCMGLLTAPADADLLDASVWQKSPQPVFRTTPETGIYGPGHSCFTTSQDGSSEILVYHARSYEKIAGDPLNDPNRHTRLQKLLWNADGSPDFGVPVPETR